MPTPSFTDFNGQIHTGWRWYDDVEKLTENTYPCYDEECPFKLRWKATSLPAFQIATAPSFGLVTSWKLYDSEGTEQADLAANIDLIKYKRISGVDYLYYLGSPLDESLDQGTYYARLVRDGVTYYSEPVTIFCETTGRDRMPPDPFGDGIYSQANTDAIWSIGSYARFLSGTMNTPGAPVSYTFEGSKVANLLEDVLYTYTSGSWVSSSPSVSRGWYDNETGNWLTYTSGGSWTITDDAIETTADGACWVGRGYPPLALIIGEEVTCESGMIRVTVYVTITTGTLTIGLTGATSVVASTTGLYQIDADLTESTVLSFTPTDSFEGCVTSVQAVCRGAAQGDCFPRLDWSHCGNVGNTYYGGGFTNAIYLPADAQPILPDTKLVIEAEEDQNGDAVETFRRKETRWSVHVGMVPWWVLDALSDLPLHDTVIMNYRDGGSDEITAISINVERPDGFGECLADVTISYQIESEAVACCDKFDPPCASPCTEAYDYDDAVPANGRTYLSVDSPRYRVYSSGFGEYQDCTSGIATIRGTFSNYEVWWDMNLQTWIRLCNITSFDTDYDEDGCFVTIEAEMPEGFSGVLQFSADGETWEDTSLDLSSDEWYETGTGVYRPEEGQETGYFRIRVYVNECTAGYSEEQSFTCPSS